MTISAAEQRGMQRALEIARRGPRGVNPQVGAVLLSPAGDILAEGWHRGAGTAHAEVDALSKLAPGEAVGATAVVTLEPCDHTGRTGPCSRALIAAGVVRVVYAIDDPGEQSAGGARTLRGAGVDVESGEQATDASALLDSWLTVQRLGRPHVTLKWAQSLDGRAAAADGTSRWITGAVARADVHRRRAEADVIVAGTGTVLADDPALTARLPDGSLHAQQPRPVVLGERPVPDGAAVRRHPLPLTRRSGADLSAVLADLREEGAHTVFVEGGPTLASAFLRAGLVDEMLAYVAPTLIGSAGGVDRPALGEIGVDTISAQRRLIVADIQTLGDDLLVIAHPTPPADAAGDEGAL